MAEPQAPKPAKLMVGLLAGREEWLNAAAGRLVEHFGATDAVSQTWPHAFTDYDAAEMGTDLRRRFMAFERLIGPDELAAIKLATNAIETELAGELHAAVRRPVNLDPGYVTAAKLVLASCKDYSHRIYLGEGVFAEVTLTYEQGAWRGLPWTYPDYRTSEYQAFFTEVRQRLRAQLRGGG